MSKVKSLRRIIGYNRTFESVLQECLLPYVRMYIGYERPIEVQLGQGRPALLVTLVPLKDSMVRLIIMPVGHVSLTTIQEFNEVLLKQKLYKFFKEIR